MIQLGALLIAIGAIIWMIGYQRDKRSRKERVITMLPETLQNKMIALRAFDPEGPAIPQVSSEYEGWFEEMGKRFAARSLHRTREEQLKLVRQVNELHEEYVKYWRTASELQKTKLEINELNSLRSEAERAELEFKIAEARDKKRRLEEDAERRKAPAAAPQRRDFVGESVASVLRTIETIAGIRAKCEELKRANPGDAEMIDRECRKAIEKTRESR
jgi:hypothetical protein